MKSLQEKFGARIKELRRAKGYTQEYLAELIDMDIPNLSNIERGKKFVSGQTISKFAKALEVEEKELFNFSHVKNKEEMIDYLTNIINNSSEKDLGFYYRIIKVYKETFS